MKLAAWLRQQKKTHEEFGQVMGGRRRETVLRWCNGHTTPDMADILKIEDVTEGAVTADDWAKQARARKDSDDMAATPEVGRP